MHLRHAPESGADGTETRPRIRLAHPVHFHVPETEIWDELKDGARRAVPAERLARLATGTLHSWVQRSCYEIGRVAGPVTIGPWLDGQAINVASVRDFGRRARRADAFVLIPRADAHPPMLADFVIHQNGRRPTGPSAAALFLWPQAGIRPRDPARGDRVETLVYKGRSANLDAAFRAPAFEAGLADLGVHLERDAIDTLRGAQRWNDYRQADLVLAVRDLTRYDARGKPASKLVNAWFADVPALLGPEPAFRELRRSALDYIEVTSPAEALDAVRRLQADPALYRAMVENGRSRRTAFAEAALTDAWIAVLDGPVARAFQRWQARPRLLRALDRWRGIALEGPSKRLHDLRIRRGPRLLGG